MVRILSSLRPGSISRSVCSPSLANCLTIWSQRSRIADIHAPRLSLDRTGASQTSFPAVENWTDIQRLDGRVRPARPTSFYGFRFCSVLARPDGATRRQTHDFTITSGIAFLSIFYDRANVIAKTCCEL